MTDWVEATKYVPPGGINFGLGDEINSFGGGQTLFSFPWDDAFVAAMEDNSPIKNKVGAAPLPGSDHVWNRPRAPGRMSITKPLTLFGVGLQQ